MLKQLYQHIFQFLYDDKFIFHIYTRRPKRKLIILIFSIIM